MANIEGGVEVIGTLVPMKENAYPVVRGCDVGLSNGDSLEEFLFNHLDSEVLDPAGGDVLDEIELSDTPFPETNSENIIRMKLKKTGKQVFCSIYASLEMPDTGTISLSALKIPEGFRPAFPVYIPYVSTKNERERGVGQYIISTHGLVNIFSSSDEAAARCASTTWIV